MKKCRLFLCLLALIAGLFYLSSCSGDDPGGPLDPSDTGDDSSSSSDLGPVGPGSSSSSSSITKGDPSKTDPVYSGTIGFTNIRTIGDEKVYFIGDNLEWNREIEVSNRDIAKCGNDEVVYSLDGEAAEDGVAVKAGKVKVCASITCDNTSYELVCEEAQVAANPHIAVCEFDYETVSDAGAQPIPDLMINDHYGRCDKEKAEYAFNPAWGPLEDKDEQEYAVSVTLNCDEKVPSVGLSHSCGTLTAMKNMPTITHPSNHGLADNFRVGENSGVKLYSIGKPIVYNSVNLASEDAGRCHVEVTFEGEGFATNFASGDVPNVNSNIVSPVPFTVVEKIICDDLSKPIVISEPRGRIVPNPVLGCNWTETVKAGDENKYPNVTMANRYGRCVDTYGYTYEGGDKDGQSYNGSFDSPGSYVIKVVPTGNCDDITEQPTASCPVNVAKAGIKTTGGIEFTGFDYKNTTEGALPNYSIGTVINVSNTFDITNKEAAGCPDFSQANITIAETGFTSGSPATLSGSDAITISVTATINCDGQTAAITKQAKIVPNPILTCEWVNIANPDKVPEGSVTPTVTVDKNYGRCTPGQATYKVGSAPFNNNIEAGQTLDVIAELTCVIGKSSQRNLSITGVCPTLKGSTEAPKFTGSIAFTNLLSNTGVDGNFYSIGATPQYNATVTINNPNQSRCEANAQLKTNGSTAAPGDIELCVYAKCEGDTGYDTKIENTCVTATVVPDPTFGPCTWDVANNTVSENGTAIPSASINNSYGRCGEPTPSSFSTADYTSPVSGVTLSTTCSNITTTTVTSAACPDLTITEVKPAFTGGKVAINFNYPGTNSNWIFEGSELTHGKGTVTINNNGANCNEVSSYIKEGPDASPVVAGETPVSITACAEVMCNGRPYKDEDVTCATVKVAPNPVLENCEWWDGNTKLSGTELLSDMAGKTVTAKAIYKNSFERCTVEPAAEITLGFGANSATAPTFTCSGNSTGAATCPALTVARPEPTASGSVSFSDYSYSGAEGDVFYKGVEVATKASGVSIANATDAGCGAVAYIIESGDVNTAGASINVCASATCNGTTKDLGICGTAKIAEDPVVTECVWKDGDVDVSDNNGILPGTYNNKSLTATATVAHSYGRCSETNPNTATITYETSVTGVTTNVTCTGYNTLGQANCANLTLASLAAPELEGLLSFNNTEGGANKVYSINATPTYSSTVKASREDCEITYIKKENGSTVSEFNTSSVKTLLVCAKAICSLDGAETAELCSEPVNVVANPSLDGECSWSANPFTVGGITPTLGGLTVENSYGRCGEISYYYENGNILEAWSGIPLNAAGTYTVLGKATCNIELSKTCANQFEVVMPSLPVCEFQQEWCPDIDWNTKINWGMSYGSYDNLAVGTPYCLFLNGETNSLPTTYCGNGDVCGHNSGDGGVYIYLKRGDNGYGGVSNVTNPKDKPTTCIGPTCEPELRCEDQEIAEGTNPDDSKLSCSCGAAMTGTPIWTGLDNTTIGEQNVTVSATCGDKQVSKSCKVDVKSAAEACNSSFTFNSSTTSWVKFCAGNINIAYSSGSQWGGCNIHCYGAGNGNMQCGSIWLNNMPASEDNPAQLSLQNNATVTCNMPPGLFCKTANCW